MKDGSKASVNGKDYTAMTDQDANDIDDDDSSVITAAEAKKKIKAELLAANSIGTVNGDATVSDGVDAAGKTTYTITKGYATVADTLSFNLHVGADADMTNKITVDIDVMNSANLGVKGLECNRRYRNSCYLCGRCNLPMLSQRFLLRDLLLVLYRTD